MVIAYFFLLFILCWCEKNDQNKTFYSPEVVADLGPVPQHDNTAGGQPKEVLDVVLTLTKIK